MTLSKHWDLLVLFGKCEAERSLLPQRVLDNALINMVWSTSLSSQGKQKAQYIDTGIVYELSEANSFY